VSDDLHGIQVDHVPATVIARVRCIIGTVELHETTTSAGRHFGIKVAVPQHPEMPEHKNAVLDARDVEELRDELNRWLTSVGRPP
jgi:hypothetical protein